MQSRSLRGRFGLPRAPAAVERLDRHRSGLSSHHGTDELRIDVHHHDGPPGALRTTPQPARSLGPIPRFALGPFTMGLPPPGDIFAPEARGAGTGLRRRCHQPGWVCEMMFNPRNM